VIDPGEDAELLPPADPGELPELLELHAARTAHAATPAAITVKRRILSS
jgi:hypothetical protein